MDFIDVHMVLWPCAWSGSMKLQRPALRRMAFHTSSSTGETLENSEIREPRKQWRWHPVVSLQMSLAVAVDTMGSKPTAAITFCSQRLRSYVEGIVLCIGHNVFIVAIPSYCSQISWMWQAVQLRWVAEDGIISQMCAHMIVSILSCKLIKFAAVVS